MTIMTINLLRVLTSISAASKAFSLSSSFWVVVANSSLVLSSSTFGDDNDVGDYCRCQLPLGIWQSLDDNRWRWRWSPRWPRAAETSWPARRPPPRPLQLAPWKWDLDHIRKLLGLHLEMRFLSSVKICNKTFPFSFFFNSTILTYRHHQSSLSTKNIHLCILGRLLTDIRPIHCVVLLHLHDDDDDKNACGGDFGENHCDGDGCERPSWPASSS